MADRCKALLISVLLAGCAGNGKGLDQNGDPIGSGGGTSGTVTADLQSIEDNVFTPICSKCHIGASAPEGLQLDAAHAYNDIVNVPSVEEPSLFRVKPGDPDDSYLVHKIEGLPGIVGGQMPLGETPLPQATIDAIRQWIANGAPNVSGSAASASVTMAAAAPFAVRHTMPFDRSSVTARLRQLVVVFTHELDATLVSSSTVSLEQLATGEAPQTGAVAAAIALRTLVPEQNGATLVIRPEAPLGPGSYRLTLRGTGGGALADLEARALAGDVTVDFTVEAAP